MIAEAIRSVVAHADLEAEAMEGAMATILAGDASPAQIAALAVGLRMKGETSIELAAAARVLRRRCEAVDAGVAGVVLDTCGTGGDGLSTFNISTVSAIVVAACGVTVAKHGNRAVSSKCGSADVLEALGVRIDLPTSKVIECVREVGIGFLFAPAHHAALRHAAPVRRELALRTIFNLLGPLANPGGANRQLVGVYDPARVRQMAEVLGLLGLEAAWVVHGEGGLDEVSPSGKTQVARLKGGRVEVGELEPADFGLEPIDMADIEGGDATTNAAIARAILGGELGAHRTAVLINAASALCVAGFAASPAEGASRAAEALDSGEAEARLKTWAEKTQRS